MKCPNPNCNITEHDHDAVFCHKYGVELSVKPNIQELTELDIRLLEIIKKIRIRKNVSRI